MYVVCVSVLVKPENVEDFKEAVLVNARETRKEPANVRFDVLQGEDDRARFFLYEVYRDGESFRAHQETEHYLAWRETVKDWMAEPRRGVKYRSLFPEQKDW